MTACDDFILDCRETLPKLCSVRDLIKAGIITSDQAAYRWRVDGGGPDWFRIKKRYFFPREGVIQFLESCKCSR